jgi:hypothetical protein
LESPVPASQYGASIVLLACFCGIARADAAPPVPGVHSAHVKVRIVTNHDHPDFLFILGPDHRESPAHFIQITPEQPFTVPGTYVHIVNLVIVRKNTATQNRSAEQIYNDSTIPGRTAYSLPLRESVPIWYGREYEVRYRVQKMSDEDRLEVVQSTVNPLWQCCLPCLAMPAVLIYSGVKLLRKKSRALPSPPTDPGSP